MRQVYIHIHLNTDPQALTEGNKWLKETGNRTLTRHAITAQVIANGAGTAAGVFWSWETELWASSVVYLAWISSWILNKISKRKTVRYYKKVHCVRICICVYCCVRNCLPFWLSLSYTFIWTTPLVLFLKITRLRPSLLVTVPSCPDSSSAHQSFPPVTSSENVLKSEHTFKAEANGISFFFCLFQTEVHERKRKITIWSKWVFQNICTNAILHRKFQVQMLCFSLHSNLQRLPHLFLKAP